MVLTSQNKLIISTLSPKPGIIIWYSKIPDIIESVLSNGIQQDYKSILNETFKKNDFIKPLFSAGEIILTEQEIVLLKIFIENKGKPLSRDLLLAAGWGYSRDTTTRTVDNFIVRFRKYFEKNPKKPVYFISRRSVGYIFDHD